MDALAAAEASGLAINKIPSGFMLDMDTYAKGAELGLPGMGVYVYGRGGALGEVDADVVAASFVVFTLETVRANWEPGLAVMPPRDAARAFLGIGVDWLAARAPEGFDAARLAALASRVAGAASPACAPLFAAWRAMPVPDDPLGAALHHVNVLRELRAAVHFACILAAGLTPLEAVLIDAPMMAGIYGWPAPYPEVEARADEWASAEQATNRALASAYGSLDDAERDELVELLTTLHAAVT